ncbi:MAG: hydrogenase expression/formation protein HypE, partial [Planctomycetales bacterium]|nr:hydrogenase expression/formation protein HypE [Planctomycetales bacterium]
DVILVSGSLGDHGMAIMSVREGLEFETNILSDSAPLNGLVAAMLQACPDIRVLRDPTRGGLASTLNEIAAASNCGLVIEEALLPIRPQVQSACELLGLEPLQVANEGKLVCIAPATSAPSLLAAMRSSPEGEDSAVIGTVVAEHPRMVVAKTAVGASRVIPLPIGEHLPRIC